jgi:hypothetical protein
MRGILVERAQQRARIMPQGMFMGNGEWILFLIPTPHSLFAQEISYCCQPPPRAL